MCIYVHAAFLLNFILKNISPKKLIKDGNWYYMTMQHELLCFTITNSGFSTDELGRTFS